MQGILELGLSPASPGGTAGDSPLALQAGREPAGALEPPLPVVEIPDATIRPYQSCAIWCPSGERLRALGEASHVFVELAAAGPGLGVVAKLRPARPDGVPDTVECTALFYAAGTQRTVDPETQLSYYSRARRIQPPSAMRAKFDWQQAQVILMELSSYVQAREAHLRGNPRDIDALTLYPRIDTRRLAAVASAARLRHVGAFIDLVLASFPENAYPVSEDSYPFANDPRMLEKLHSIVSTNTSRFAAFRGGPPAAPEADGEEWPLDSGAGWNLGDDSAKESRGRNIDDSLMPEEAKQVARHELERGETEHVDLLLSLPWGKRSEVRVNLADAQRRLDAGHYGLAKAKRCIIEYLAVQALSDRPPPQVLCLVGPPGCGKTSLGRAIARATNREYGRLSVGGMRDELQFLGCKREYRNARHGEIIETLRRLQVSNPVLLLDEVDKIGATAESDPSAALLAVLDPELNHAFRDHYLNVPFDLSGVLFVCTANCIDQISPPLRDRMEVIQIEPYTEQEKIQIAREHILPREIERAGLTAHLESGRIKIAADALSTLVTEYPHEGGVRNLARRVQSMCRQIAYRAVTAGEQQTALRLRIQKENIAQFVPRAAPAPSLIGFDRARK